MCGISILFWDVEIGVSWRWSRIKHSSFIFSIYTCFNCRKNTYFRFNILFWNVEIEVEGGMGSSIGHSYYPSTLASIVEKVHIFILKNDNFENLWSGCTSKNNYITLKLYFYLTFPFRYFIEWTICCLTFPYTHNCRARFL